MATANRTVDVTINVKGNTADFTSIISKFNNIRLAVDNVTNTVNSLKGVMSSIGTSSTGLSGLATSLSAIASVEKSPGLQSIVKNLRDLSKVDKFPQLGTITGHLSTLSNLKEPTGFTNAVKSLHSLSSVKTPPDLKKFAESIAVLSNVGKFPNLKQIAEGFEKFVGLKKPQNLSDFVTELKKFSGITVPNIKQIGTGLEKLAGLDMSTVGASLRVLYRNLRRFTELSIPNITKITDGLRELIKINTQTSVSQLSALSSALSLFKDVKIPNIAKIAEGLRSLAKIDTQRSSSQINALASAIRSFGTASFPQIIPFVNGLRELTKVNTQNSVSQLHALASAVHAFGTSKLPAIAPLAKGLRELANINTQSSVSQLNALASSIRTFSDKSSFKDISKLYDGLKSLLKVDTQRSVSQLLALSGAMKTFKGITIPSLLSLITSLRELTKINTQSSVSQINALAFAMKQFPELKLASIKTFVIGLRDLLKINTQSSVSQLNALASALRGFPKNLNVGWMSAFAEGLRKLTKIDTQRSVSQLNALSGIINQFTDRKVPNMASFVRGLNGLIALDIKAVVLRIRQLSSSIRLLDKAGYLKSFASFASDLNKISVGLVNANAAAGQAKKGLSDLGSVTANTGERIRTFGDRVRNYFQYRVVADFVMQLKTAFTEAITAIGQYDQALKDLQAITGATALEVTQMGVTIKEVASTTKFSAQEVAEGMRTLGQAGLSANESISSMQYVSNLATGTLSDMSTTVDLVTTALRVFRMEASESEVITDVFANAVNRSKLTIDKLRTAMNYVGPIAQSAGVSLQEMSASMMTLANSGLRASTIGTGLRRVFAELVDPSKKLTEAANRAGVSLAELDPQTNSLQDVISNLGLVISDTGTAFDIFGKRGAAAVLALSSGQSQFNSMLDTVSKSGTAAKMAATQMEGLGVSFKNLKDKLGNLAIAFGESGFITAFKLMIDGARAVVDAFTALTNNTFGKFIIQTSLVTVAITGLVTAVGLLGAAFNALRLASVVSWIAQFSAMIFQAIAPMSSYASATYIAAGASSSLTGAVGALTASFATLWAAIWPILAVAAIIAGIALAVKGLIAVVDNLTSSAQESSKEAKLLAGEYDRIGKAVKNYDVAMASLNANSKEAIEQNKKIRNTLLEVAESESELADEAREAVGSISAMTGKLYDGGEALANFREEAERLKNVELAKAFTEGFNALEQQMGNMQGFLDFFSDLKTTAKLSLDGIKQIFTEFSWGNLLKGAAGTVNPFSWLINGAFNAKEKINKHITSAMDAADFADALSKGEISWKEYAERVELILQKSEKDQTSREKRLAEQFTARTNDAREIVEQLGQAGIDAGSRTSEQMIAAAKSMGLLEGASELALEGLKATIEEMSGNSGFSNVIEKWEAGMGDVNLSINDIASTVSEAGGVFTAEHQKRIEESKQQREEYRRDQQALIDKYNAISKAQAEAIDAAKTNNEKQIISDEFTAQLQQVLNDADALRKNYNENTTAGDKKALDKLVVNHEKAMAKMLVANKGNFQAISSETVRLGAKFIAEYNKLVNKTLNSDEILSASKTVLASYKAEYKKALYDIELAEANSAISHEDAEKRKLTVSLNHYADLVKVAEDSYARIEALGTGANEEDLEKARLDRIKAIEAENNAKLKLIQSYGKDYETAKNKLNAVDSKRKAEVKKNSEEEKDIREKAFKDMEEVGDNYRKTRLSMEKDLSKKIASIAKDLTDKLKDFVQDRVDAEKDGAAKIAGLNDSLQDKLRKLNQRGMTDAQKDADNRHAAARKLSEGEAIVAKARAEGDEAALARGQKLIDQAGSLYEGLEDTDAARSGIIAVTEALKNVAGVELEFDKNAIDEAEQKAKKKAQDDINNANALHKDKLTNLKVETLEALGAIAEISKEALDKEGKRHRTVMENMAKEVAKFKSEMDLAANLRAGVQEDATKDKKGSSDAGYDDVSQSAQTAKEKTAELAEAMGVVREEAETDIEFELRVSNTQQVTDVIKRLKAEAEEGATVEVNAVTGEIEDPAEEFDLEDQTVDISLTGDEVVNAIITEVETSLAIIGEGTEVGISADTEGKDKVDELGKAIDELEDKTVTVTVNTVTSNAVAASTGGLIQGFSMGGMVDSAVQFFADGGSVFKKLTNPLITLGSGLKDDVPAMLTKGEFVHIPQAVRHYGLDFMRAVNNLTLPKPAFFAEGGGVGTIPSSSSTSSSMPNFGTLKLDLPTQGPPIDIALDSFQLDEIIRQISERNRMKSGS